jgi:hypothetical protein
MNPPNECSGFLCTGHTPTEPFTLYSHSADYTTWPPYIPSRPDSIGKTGSWYYTNSSTKVVWNSDGTITFTDPDGTTRTINRWDDGDNGN